MRRNDLITGFGTWIELTPLGVERCVEREKEATSSSREE